MATVRIRSGSGPCILRSLQSNVQSLLPTLSVSQCRSSLDQTRAMSYLISLYLIMALMLFPHKGPNQYSEFNIKILRVRNSHLHVIRITRMQFTRVTLFNVAFRGGWVWCHMHWYVGVDSYTSCTTLFTRQTLDYFRLLWLVNNSVITMCAYIHRDLHVNF